MKFDLGKWSLDNRKLVSMFVFILVAGGIYSYYRMPKLEDPEIIVRQSLVVGIYPGASAHQTELELAAPLEKNIRETPGVYFIESHCYSDMCILKVSLNTAVPQEDIMQTWDIMRHKVEQTPLPAGATTMVRDDFGDVYGLFYAVSAEGLDMKELGRYVDMIRREVQNVPGVSRVNTYGAPSECIRLNVRTDRLASLNIHPLEVIQTLNGQNATVYSGYFLSGGNRIRVSVDDRYRDIEDIGDLIICGHESEQIQLRDIADIRREEETPVREYMERDGVRCIGLSISTTSDSDIIKVGRAVEKKIGELQETRLPLGVSIDKIFNQKDKVADAMNDFMLNLLLSVILVILILVFTMGLRSGMIIGVSLAVIVAGSVFILDYSGGTLQRVSLCSFLVAMGMLVDNAIVIVDGMLVAKSEGKRRKEVLTEIGRKTMWPLLGATLIVILSLLPIYLSPDVTGIYVHDMFIILAVSLLLSWILALTHIPIMADRYLYDHIKPVSQTSLYEKKPYKLLREILGYTLEHRKLTIGIACALLLIAGGLFLLVPRALFPDMEYDQCYMEYKLPEGNNYNRVKADLDSISVYLAGKPYIKHITQSLGGTPARYNLVRSIHLPSLSYGELILDFTSARELEKNLNTLQTELEDMYPDAHLRLKRYNLMFMPYPIQLLIKGPDPAVLDSIKTQFLDVFETCNVCTSIDDVWEQPQPSLVVKYNQNRARLAGLSRQEVGMSLLASTDGVPVGSFYDGTEQMNIYLGCTGYEGKRLEDISDATIFGLAPELKDLNLYNFNLPQSLTRSRPLREITDGVKVEWEEQAIYRYNSIRTKMICAFPKNGLTTEEARLKIARKIDRIELPYGYSYEWAGERLAEDLSMEKLFANYPLALLLMLTVLLLLFKDFKVMAILICSIPAVFVGVVPAVLVTGSTFGFVTIVGTLGLVGMIIKNGIVLLDEINLQVSKGSNLKASIVEASLSRLRPVTMASLTTILGMVPLLFDAMFKSLAAAIIGGLLVGTAIVLVLIPVLYIEFFKK